MTHADDAARRARAPPLPEGVTAHKLRHTFASILFVRGEDPPYVMAQLGHTDPAFTLRVYAHAMRRDDGDKERLKALVEGRDWAPMGTTGPDDASDAVEDHSTGNDETPASAEVSDDGRGGFRTCDLSRVKQRGAGALRAFAPANRANQEPRTAIESIPMRLGTAGFGPTIGPTAGLTICGA